MKHNDKLYSVDISHSDGTFEQSWRVGANAWNLKLTKKLLFNFSAQLWHQPEIQYYVDNKIAISEGLGAMILTTTHYDFISEENILGIHFQLGYKSNGFALGEALDNGLVVRGGISFR